MLKDLVDTIKAFETYRSHQSQEMTRLNERLSNLVHSREEASHLVENDNGNDVARLRLDTADREIAEIKREIAVLQKQMAGDIRSRRAEILEKHEQALTNLDHQLQNRHTKQIQIKNVLIPRAEKRLTSLQEELSTTQEEVQRIQKEIEQINNLDLDILLQSPEKV